ncbi:MAG: AarF/ABC1/UbiB kinase family protein [Desulfobacteraceae bacterium]|jgi:ubiquinone biosynthesis protein
MMIRKIGAIGRTYRHMERYVEILTVLFKFGFGDVINSLKIEQYLDLGRRVFSGKDRERLEALSRPERLRMALEELGPTFIKLGQVLSARADLLPDDFIHELTKLQDEVPPVPYEDVEKVLAAELKGTQSEVFREVDKDALAGASIGQVHLAHLADGEPVAIKIQRPGIRRTVEVDLEILFHLATLMEKHLEGWDFHRPTRIVEEFAHIMGRELDYTVEAVNMEHFASLFLDDRDVYVPKVFREATTSRVLTMEYIDGIKSSSLDLLRSRGYDLAEIAHRGGDLILKQIFVHGFFHADPHPGNLLILPQNVICFLDMGMVGRLDRESREDLADLLMGLAKRDASAVTDALLTITLWDTEPDRHVLERDVSEFMDRHFYKPLKELEFGKLIHQLFDMASRHHLRLPPDILFLIKVFNALESLGRGLDPDFDIIERAAPFVGRVQRERLQPRRLAEDLIGYSAQLIRLAKTIPNDIQATLKLARQGKLKIGFEHKGLEPLLTTLDRTSNRLAFAVVIASLIIGSSLVIHADIPPKWHDVPLIGLAGYVVAGVMGFWLLVSILRRGRM